MKNVIPTIIICFLFLAISFSDSTISFSSNINKTEILVRAKNGGMYKPSENKPGEFMRALVVFVQFKNDSSEIGNWQKDKLPDWNDKLFDAEISSSYRPFTVSDYFKQMSNGKFDFIGDVYPKLITMDSIFYYSKINEAVIKKLDDAGVDFHKYDNWKFDSEKFEFKEKNGDGIMDMLIIIYRAADYKKFGLGGGIAGLGLTKEYYTHDGILINGSVLNVKGSGITSNMHANGHDNLEMVSHIAHEYGHYLLGGGHTRTSGIMVGVPFSYYSNTFAMSSLEKERLGYSSFITAVKDGDSFNLKDFVTTNEALKINIPFGDTSSSEFFILENHQRKTIYDQIIRGGKQGGKVDPDSKLGKGIYVWYVKNGRIIPPDIFALTADGSWDWQFAGDIKMPHGWPSTLELLARGKPLIYLPRFTNEPGKGDRNPSLYADVRENKKTLDRWHSYNMKTKSWELSRCVMGDENDAFTLDYNNQITPWSNPSTTKFDGKQEIPTNISIVITGERDDEISVKIYSTYNSALSLPPSKPQKLSVKVDENKHVNLLWLSNLEPDMLEGGSYKIFRSMDDLNYEEIGKVNHQKDSIQNYIDKSLIIKENNTNQYSYKISAVDKSGKESLKSETDWAR